MTDNEGLSEFVPDGQDDGEDVEILEVVGVDEDRDHETFPQLPVAPDPKPQAESSPEDEEYVLDMDDPGAGILADAEEESPEDGPDSDRTRLIRLRADYDNLRKRIDRERGEFELHANFNLVTRLLPVLDNLDRARAAEAKSDSGGALREGLILIHRQLTEQLNSEGLRSIEAVGQPFDPNLHDAVATDPTSDLPRNTIIEEMQKGYLFHNRVLRPAMVKVSTHYGPDDEES